MVVIYGCSSCDLWFLIRTNTRVMKWSENVKSFGIKHNCNWLDLDKVSLKLAYKNLVCSKLKPILKYFLFYFKEKDFHMDCCKWKIWEVLTARKANSLSLLMLAKKSQCAQRPFVTHIFLSRQHGIQVATFCHHFLKHIFILQSTDFHFVSFHVVLQITVSHLHCKKEGIKCTRKNKKKIQSCCFDH